MPNIHTPSKVVINKLSLAPQAFTTDTGAHNGTGIDCLGARVAMIDIAAHLTAGNSTFTVDDSADNNSWNSDVFSGGNEFAVIINTGATGTQLNQPGHQVMSINLAKRKRYIRVTVTNAAATGQLYALVSLFNENYLYDATTGDAISQDNADIVN